MKKIADTITSDFSKDARRIVASILALALMSSCSPVRLLHQSLSSYSANPSNGSGASVTSTAATRISARGFSTCALMADQSVECWGDNSFGQLGDGTLTTTGSPVKVSGLSGAVDLSVGYYHACAVLSDGSVKCWGKNASGQLGNGTTTNSATPVNVSSITNAVRVAAAQDHTCAILSASPWVQCWGDNGKSELGNAGAGSGSSTPVNVSLGAMPVAAAPRAISAGSAHTCVIDGSTSKNVWCWGSNANGQLGDATSTDRASAVQAGTLSAGSLALNSISSCAIDTTGTPYCWGEGYWGEFGTAVPSAYNTPTVAANNTSPVTTAANLAITSSSGCAALTDGTVSCWGANFRGDTANGTSAPTANQVPFNIPSLSGITQLAAGTLHMCALDGSGKVSCWGHNSLGTSGAASISPQTPVLVSGLNTVSQIKGSPGGQWLCARLSNGDVYCWGSTTYGLTGDGSTWYSDLSTPALIPNASMGAAVDLGVGDHQACIVNSGGQVWCWGIDQDKILSNAGAGGAVLAPVQQAGITGALKIHVGYNFVCATLNAAPYVQCWGTNDLGQLGNGTTTASYAPVTATGFTATPALIGGTQYSVCATISASPYLMCWGNGIAGELGNGTNTWSTTPSNATSVGLAAVPLDLTNNGVASMCAVTSAGGVVCWGANSNQTNANSQSWTAGIFYGMLGDGGTTDTGAGAAVVAGYPSAITGAGAVGGGGFTNCAVTNPGPSGTAQCWGANNFGQAGAAPGASAFNAVTLPGSGYVSIAGGDNTLCALMSNNTVQCWGDGAGGELGNGSFRQIDTPASVSLF